MNKRKLLIFPIILLLLLMVGCANDANNNAVNDAAENNASNAAANDAVEVEASILDNLGNEDYIFIDTRQNDSFLGWDLDGKAGHLEGAVDFSFNWLSAEDELLVKTLEVKGITADKNIVLYDTNLEQAEQVKTFLTGKGFESVEIFDLNTYEGELVKYPNYQLVVPAQIVKAVIDGETPQTFENATTIKVVEASWGPADASYDAGHVPTTFHINTDAVEPPPAWMLASDAELEAFLLEHGFQSTDTVIVTGGEQMAAYRVALVLRYCGVEDVRVLNGGDSAWVAAGYELSTETVLPTPVDSFGTTVPAREDLVETIEELQVSLNDDSFTLVDNRTWAEHIGEDTGYSYHDLAGRIPGSVFGYAGEGTSWSMSYFRNPDNTMRRPEEFIALWEGQGIDTNNRLAFMCGSGWRAAEILYYADVAGLPSITLYSDGWIGWSLKGLPTETGE